MEAVTEEQLVELEGRFKDAMLDSGYARLSSLAKDAVPALISTIRAQRSALEAIDTLLSEEIAARFGGDSQKTEAEIAGRSRIYPLLNVPRNMARAALSLTKEPSNGR